jgi:aubergine-like protein
VLALKSSIKKDTQMVVCVVTSKRKDRYDAIKRICCLEIPVPSQVITTQLIEDIKKKMPVITKVAIQMNVKLGGELWATSVPVK